VLAAGAAADQGIGALAGGGATATLAVVALRMVWASYQAALARGDQIQQERLADAKETAAVLATTARLLERATVTLERQVSSNQAGGG